MILLIDNYDSFTYNLYQQLESLGAHTKVFTHDQIGIREIAKLNPQKIIISPGPKTPKESGISNQVIKHFYQTKPILGVCLGHECIGEFFGSNVVHARQIMHGKVSLIQHSGQRLFQQLPQNTKVARYHSLILDKVPVDFHLDAWTDQKEIMAISHKAYPLYGLQFHPESFMTPQGNKIIQNFLNV